MSIAGNAAKVCQTVQQIKDDIQEKTDWSNITEIQSLGLGLRWMIAKLNLELKHREQMNKQKYERI